MAKSKKQTNSLKIIEAYFTTENEHYNGFTFDIYNEANMNNLFPNIEIPLLIFDNAVSEFYESRNKPLQVLHELKEIFAKNKLNSEQKSFILKHLIAYFGNTAYPDSSGKKEIMLTKVEKLLEKELEYIEPPAIKIKSIYNFESVKKHLKSLSTTKDQIKFLTEIKTEYIQNKTGFEVHTVTPFDYQCELEIQKILRLLQLEQQPTNQQTKPQLGSFTNSQTVLIFYYFFKQNGLEPRVDIDISPIAKFIHLITGKELKAVTSSDFYKKLQTVPNFKSDKELINDLEAIKPLFQMVKLDEVVRMIGNEIDLARSEMKQKKNRI